MSVREDERQRLARELHDELGGLLTAAKLDLARMRSGGPLPPALAERVQKVNERLNDGISLKRRIIEDLRPSALDQLGLTASLRALCQDAAEGLGIEIEQVLQEVDLAPDVNLTVYRLVQESLTNIRKYAHARRVVVRLAQPLRGSVQVSVQDDGSGFDLRTASVGRHGLAGMRYRVEAHGGSMQITSSPGKGTMVSAVLPSASASGARAAA
jgi:signal transduction histidine kinase